MSYLNFFSFAKAIQDGYHNNNYPVLSALDFEQAFSRSLRKLLNINNSLSVLLTPSYDRKLIFQAINFEVAEAYWISPTGMIRPVTASHIDDIVNCPANFGLTEDYILEIYTKHNEPLRTEKHARDEIVDGLFKKGWVRIRYYCGVDFYSVELGALTKKNKEYLFEWAYKTLESFPDRDSCKVAIVAHSAKNRHELTLAGLIGEALLNRKEQRLPVTHFLVPVSSSADFTESWPLDDMKRKLNNLQSGKNRKQSKYNGVLVNTPNDSSTDVSAVVPAAIIASDANSLSYPSIRFLVVDNMVSSQKKELVRPSLSGSLDTFLVQNYLAGLGSSVAGPDIKDSGNNGKVVLRFDSNSGHSTEVNLGVNLDNGYVVESINDELGLFPEGTVDGDFLEISIVQQILRSQGERDRQEVMGYYKDSVDVMGNKEENFSCWVSSDTKRHYLGDKNHFEFILDNYDMFRILKDQVSRFTAASPEERLEMSDSWIIQAYLFGWVRVRDYGSEFILEHRNSRIAYKSIFRWAIAMNEHDRGHIRAIIIDDELGVISKHKVKDIALNQEILLQSIRHWYSTKNDRKNTIITSNFYKNVGPTIRQIFANTTYPNYKAISDLINYIGMSMDNAEALINHWKADTKLIKSITGPRTLQEWHLYERAKKMHDGGFNYRDTVGILARVAGIMPKRAEEAIGTSEEWKLGYFDLGLAPLKEENYPVSDEPVEKVSVNSEDDSQQIFSMAKQLSKGIFWIVSENYDLSDWRLIFFDIPCDLNGNSEGIPSIKPNSKSGLTYNHKHIWEETIKKNSTYSPYNKKEYDYYPRGRVEISNNKATIYLNPHINSEDIINNIKSKFGLSFYNISEVNVNVDGSSHYKCFLDKT